MTETAITKALEEVRARISRVEQERAELERTITAAREEERLLQRLLALRRGHLPSEVAEQTAYQTGKAGTPKEIQLVQAVHKIGHTVVEAVLHELASAGRPLHISDLMRLLHEARVEIPGAGTQANLITHLRRDPRLVRPSRGIYGLATWGLENMPTLARRKRRKRRVRSATAINRKETQL